MCADNAEHFKVIHNVLTELTKELSEKSKELLQQIISEAKVSGMTKEEFFEICGELYE